MAITFDQDGAVLPDQLEPFTTRPMSLDRAFQEVYREEADGGHMTAEELQKNAAAFSTLVRVLGMTKGGMY